MKVKGWRAVAFAAGCAVAAGAVVAIGARGGAPVQRVQLLAGSAWLASDRVGQLTLLDGASAEVAAQVQVAPAGDALKVVQRGSSAYAVDQSAGTIRWVDGATYAMSQPRSPIPGAKGGLTAYAGSDVVYALDSQRGVIASADPKTLDGRSDPAPVAERFADGTAAMDEHGALWMVDRGTGDLASYVDGKRSTRNTVTKPGNSVVTVANGRPVVVNSDTREAVTIDPGSGDADRTFPLELRQGDQVQVSGSPHRGDLYVIASRGVLNICDVDAGTCDHAVPLNADSTFGAPVEAADRLFVPDYKSGEVWIVDLRGNRVLTRTSVLPPGGPFQLLARDGVVFFNDTKSEKAGVLQLDGTLNRAAKYDPAHPLDGLSAGGPQAANNPGNPSPQTGGGQNQPTGTNQPVDQPGHPNQPSQPNQPSRPNQRNQPSQPDQPGQPNQPGQPDPGRPDVTAHITVSNANPKAGQEVTMAVGLTPAADIDTIDWTFGEPGEGHATAVTHTWQTPSPPDQPYPVAVQVKLKDGRTVTDTTHVNVTPKDKATLTVTAKTGGKVQADGIDCGTDCTQTVEEGTVFHLTAKADQDYRFDGWGDGPCKQYGTGQCTLTMGSENTGGVSAVFSSTKVDLTFSVPEGGGRIQFDGNSCADLCTLSFPKDDTIALSYQVADDDHEFVSWENGCPGNGNNCTIKADHPKRIVAHFKAKDKVTLNVSVGEGGKVDVQTKGACSAFNKPHGADCSYTFVKGSMIKLTVSVQKSSIGSFDFKEWRDACAGYGNKECTLTLNDPQVKATAYVEYLG